ncbi:hypothetical protein F164LOC_07980 [Pectobacterium carotovorum]|nr:hypothetical protein F164LOC_07980 [Pectobacterium carotovorum]
MHVRWLHSVTRITYSSKLIGMPALAACLKLELFRIYIFVTNMSSVLARFFSTRKFMMRMIICQLIHFIDNK